MRKFGWLLVLMAALCLWTGAAAEEETLSFRAILPAVHGTAEVQSHFLQEESGEAHWLFLPSFADLSAVSVHCEADGLAWPWGDAFESGEAVDVLSRFEQTEEGVYSADLVLDDQTVRLSVMQSANLRTLFFFSDDPENHGRAWIDNCVKHVNETSGSMALVDADGTVDHSARVENWRGRGNTTWNYVKKPYQLKLEYKADLLKTGIASERSRTWVLLADAVDETLLRDKIAFDLGLELGMSETSRSEYVDLYYDGEYMGIYLLCEKVQVENGRVEMLDYDRMIESWNRAVGKYDLSALPAGQAENAFGLPYTYIEGLAESSDPASGAYLLEMESVFTLSDRCHFELGDGSVLALKNPENASSAMVAYVSEKLEILRRALDNHGTDPQTGAKASDLMDFDAFARIAIINELGCNMDGFSYSSSFFLLPEGSESRFRPGPVWDFALAFRDITEPGSDGHTGFKPNGWIPLFYGVPELRGTVQRIWQEELAPCVQNILLGTENGRWLQPIETYAQHIAQAMRMSKRLWTVAGYATKTPPADLAQALKEYIAARFAWLDERIRAWDQETADTLELEAEAVYLIMEDSFKVQLRRWSNATMTGWELSQLTEATEEEYALWQLTADFVPLEGYAFSENTHVLFNDSEVLCEPHPDGTLTATAIFEDPSYRPVDAYGEDIGMVFDADFYAANYPDVAEECGDDPVMMAEYFFEIGMEEGQQGNAFFWPRGVQKLIPELDDMYGDMWSMYYWDFICDYYLEWMPILNERYRPAAIDMQAAQDFLQEGLK